MNIKKTISYLTYLSKENEFSKTTLQFNLFNHDRITIWRMKYVFMRYTETTYKLNIFIK